MPKLIRYALAGALFVLPAVAHAQATGAAAEKGKMEKREERMEKKEPHRAIRVAIKQLERTRGELERAASDFGGHKAEAIKGIDDALKHLNLALAADKK